MSYALDREITGTAKSLKLFAENPQCKSLENARNVSIDPDFRILQKKLMLRSEVTVPHSAPRVHAAHTHLCHNVSMGSGSRLSFEIYMQEDTADPQVDTCSHT